MANKLKNGIINLSLLTGSILLFFGGIEIALRITGLQTVKPKPIGIYQKSTYPEISYELIPSSRKRAFRSTITTNSLGFRSPELDPDKPTIAVLGDSITFGYGVEDDETIPANLGALLPEYNVLNAAAPGYNLSQQTGIYRHKLAALDPKFLILIMHFNDVENGGGETAVLDGEGFMRPSDYEPEKVQCAPIEQGILAFIPGKCWLDIHSAFYKAIKKVINARYGKQALEEREEEEEVKPVEENITEKDLKIYAQNLDGLVAVLPSTLPRLFVIWPEWRMHETVRPKLRAIAEARGFKVLDLYDSFGGNAETLGWDTVHPSANATRQGAMFIYKALAGIL